MDDLALITLTAATLLRQPDTTVSQLQASAAVDTALMLRSMACGRLALLANGRRAVAD